LWGGAGGASSTRALPPGAGAPLDSPFLSGFATALAATGVEVLRCNFPYQDAVGRRPPDREPILRATWRAAFAAAAARAGDRPILAGGKSLGGRIASLATADGEIAPAGLVFLGYPLHPPGRPERIRDAHLGRIACPILWLQGTRDPFARPDLLHAVVDRLAGRATLVEIEGGDHSFHRPRTPRDPAADGAALVPSVRPFIDRLRRSA
jgi:predicted alpha/beta-hydrolase family hydrolase